MSGAGRGRVGRPELIFFDVGDTLIRAEPSWPEIYVRACRPFGIEIDPDQLARVLTAATWDPGLTFEPTEEASYERIRAFDEGILAELGYRNLPDSLYRAIGDAFAVREAWFVFEDVAPALEALDRAGIRRAVISNWVWGAPALLHDLELAARFETLVISARVGFQKPARQIFDRALEATGIRPERALHVGDSFSADVVGARSVGITPVLIDRTVGDQARGAATVIPDGDDVAVIRDLYELLDLVGVPRPALAARG